MSENFERLLWLHLIGVAAFNNVDFFLTLDALEKGYSEVNPIMAPMIGTYAFPMIKLILMPLLLIFLWQMRHRMGKSLVTLTWIPFIGYFSLMVYYRVVII